MAMSGRGGPAGPQVPNIILELYHTILMNMQKTYPGTEFTYHTRKRFAMWLTSTWETLGDKGVTFFRIQR